MVVDVEARTVAEVLPAFRRHLDARTNLLEIAGQVEDRDHGQPEAEECLY